jgi:hypothetical protein
MTPSSSPASDRIHGPTVALLRSALVEALGHGMACMDNTSDHRQPISESDARSLLRLTHQIQRAILAAACLDLSHRP